MQCYSASVGIVDGRGYDGQQKDAICDVCGPCQRILSSVKPVFSLISTGCLGLRVAQALKTLKSGDFRGDNA